MTLEPSYLSARLDKAAREVAEASELLAEAMKEHKEAEEEAATAARAAREREVFKRCTSCRMVRRVPESIVRCAELAYPGCKSHSGEFVVDEGCHAVLFHGPGHQSKARCRLTGEHAVHEAIYHGNSVAWWRGEESTTGYFDEPPEVED